ncbi:MAG TPA: LuxR family transcriptional regulator, partial [Rhizobiaceae bacterium]|nr:LuxR family transcriptional regulator [Rhizobiaceae bacterium]
MTRREVAASIRRLCNEAGGSFYMLLDATDGGGSGTGRILVSNWSYDAVQAVGDEGLVRLTEGK